MTLSQVEIRQLKSKAQLLEPVLKIGKLGLTPPFFKEFRHALHHHPLLKIQFSALKDQKKALSAELAEKSGTHLIQLVGNVAVFYRGDDDAPAT